MRIQAIAFSQLPVGNQVRHAAVKFDFKCILPGQKSHSSNLFKGRCTQRFSAVVNMHMTGQMIANPQPKDF